MLLIVSCPLLQTVFTVHKNGQIVKNPDFIKVEGQKMNIIEVASVWILDNSPYSLQQNEIVPMLSIQMAIKDKQTVDLRIL